MCIYIKEKNQPPNNDDDNSNNNNNNNNSNSNSNSKRDSPPFCDKNPPTWFSAGSGWLAGCFLSGLWNGASQVEARITFQWYKVLSNVYLIQKSQKSSPAFTANLGASHQKIQQRCEVLLLSAWSLWQELAEDVVDISPCWASRTAKALLGFDCPEEIIERQ